ncbi:MAG TPA: 30S ribosomal protein S6 [Anaerolineae bacterium]|nr:30S ribosomal protein S6 [Anaerolineae bacterium]
MREYELYVVVDGGAEEEAVKATLDRASQLIAVGNGESAGQVIKVEPRGKRRLAYPIGKKLEGQDFVVTFQTAPQALPELERALKLDEQVLRYLIVRLGED